MRNWKGILAMGLSSALVIGTIQLVPEQTAKNANAETVNTSDNMTPPSGMPQGTPPAKPDGDTNGGPGGSAPGGSGIGLSVAKSIVTLHGGTIHAKSDDGKKNTDYYFYVVLFNFLSIYHIATPAYSFL